jgi:chromosome segregation protein
LYLKSLEIVGFKSFADKTRLEFEPGMTAIVGPNGCGKSNVADSLRWVLGEQSAKALRGAKMEDVIFNGTDAHKPLGMAEVSLCLADCEAVLGTEYNEVTITRRVFRTGEGQYFINKAACRLKDIQRLFMDTGIGTNAYSLMEQGRIDKILSSHPEDRRAVFEEASGITKFKADKRRPCASWSRPRPTCSAWTTSSRKSNGRSSPCSARPARPSATRNCTAACAPSISTPPASACSRWKPKSAPWNST